MEVDFEHRSPTADDVLRVGMVDLQDGDRWIELGTTSAWCWQQGCMLQWLPGSKTEVLWNDRQDDKFVCHILDVQTRKQRTLPAPVYAVSPDGRWAISTDFRRLNDQRPGYGYAGIADPNKDKLAPDDVGIWKLDLTTGKQTLLVSVADAVKFPNPDRDWLGAKHWFNHLLVSPDGKRFIFLHRWRGKARAVAPVPENKRLKPYPLAARSASVEPMHAVLEGAQPRRKYADLPPKKRVWGFREPKRFRIRKTASQVVETRLEIRLTATIFVSGLSVYNNADQLLTENGITYTYDLNGNLKTKTDATGTTTYSWDYEDRLVKVAGPGGTVTYEYDVDGNRVSLTDFLPQSEQDISKLFDRLRSTLLKLGNPHLRALAECFLMDDTFVQDFCKVPAGIRNHHVDLPGCLQEPSGDLPRRRPVTDIERVAVDTSTQRPTPPRNRLQSVSPPRSQA